MTSYPSATSLCTTDPSTATRAPRHPRNTAAEQTGRSSLKEPTPVDLTSVVQREPTALELHRPRLLIHPPRLRRRASLPRATASASSHSSSPPKFSGGLFASRDARL